VTLASSLIRAISAFALLGASIYPGYASATTPIQEITSEGRFVVEAAVDQQRITLAITGRGSTAAAAVATRDAAVLALSLPPINPTAAPAEAVSIETPPVKENGQWLAAREIRRLFSREAGDALLLRAGENAAVRIVSIEPKQSQLPKLQHEAIVGATQHARKKAESAARELGFALGALQHVEVKQEERLGANIIDVEARVIVRHALLPATTRAEILAIAAAQDTTSTGQPAARESTREPAEESKALPVDIIAAAYDSTGRGRFTTSTGTIWREIVPTPARQRLREGRRYTGSIALGIFGGYRLELDGVPRILKVEPVTLGAESRIAP
jgi:hypothetical protein